MNKIIDYIRTSIGFQTIALWLLVFILAFPHNIWISVGLSFKIAVLTLVSIMTTYYLTQKVLIPKMAMKKKRKVLFVISSLLMLGILINISARLETYIYYKYVEEPIAYQEPMEYYEFKGIFSMSKYIALLTIAYAVSNIVTFAKKAKETFKLKDALLSERKMLETRVLKSQINSHFVFNALNNIYSMTYFKDEYTSGYVLKLAHMMRYLMEDCETELTPLIKDIEYVQNFFDFQKLRFEGDKDISFTYRVDENASVSIPPMIFQPLVENCFKHTPLEVDKNSYIHISLEATNEHVHFVAVNSQPLLKHEPTVKEGGIGIGNVRRRLDLYYDDKYTLDISSNEDSFKVELFIYLNRQNKHVTGAKGPCC